MNDPVTALIRLEHPNVPVMTNANWNLMKHKMDLSVDHRKKDFLVSKTRAFEIFTEKSERIEKMYLQLHTLLLEAVGKCNGFPQFYGFHDGQIPKLTAGAQDAVGTELDVFNTLQMKIHSAGDLMIQSFLHRLWFNVDARWMGLINWIGPKEMQYAEFRYEHERKHTHRTETSYDYTDHYVDIYRHTLSVHDVIEAKEIPVSDYKQPIPRRVQKVIENIPDWLRPAVHIADGTEVRKTTLSHEVARETWANSVPKPIPVVRYDPCLTIGPYVLCGWDAGER